MTQPRFMHVPRTGGTSLVAGWGLTTPEYEGHSLLADADHWLYGFTRNPFDRLVSLYLHSQGELTAGSLPDWLRLGMPSVQCPAERMQLLGQPASAWLQRADWVGRFERREEDLAQLAEILGREVPENHAGRSEGRRPYQEYYTDGARKLVEQVYAPDLERWGYVF